MVELELVGLHSDGDRLTLAGPDGQRYQLVVDDALRAAVRRDRPQLEQIRADAAPLRPREIQSRIRAGATAAEVAEQAGLPLAHVRRYEGPVLAEREWLISQARMLPIGRGEGAPQLGDLVVDRLATRDVDTETLEWDAVRPPGGTWQLLVRFRAGERDRTARWAVDMSARAARATDDESRWLSETEVSAPSGRRHLSPVPVYDVVADGDLGPALAAVDEDLRDRHRHDVPAGTSPAIDTGEPETGAMPALSTDDLLSELRASRGTRHGIDLGGEPGDDHDAEGGLEGAEEPTLWGASLPPAAHPPASRPEEARDAHVLPMPRGASSTAPPPAQDPPVPSTPTTATPSSAASAAGTGPPPEEQREHPSRRAERQREEARDAEPHTRPRRRPRSGRASVPSWDEIVFGARPD